MVKLIIISILFISNSLFAQDKKFSTEEVSTSTLINGILYKPENYSKKTKLVIIIAGSGIPDRDGNAPGIQTNSTKYLSEDLAKNGYAVYAFDKRTIAQIKAGNVSEKDMSFDDLIADAKDIIKYFRAKKAYSKIIIAGHSEGSLVGMIAARDNADAFISLAGMGRSFDEVVVEQIAKQAPFLKEETQKNFDLLKSGQTFELKNQMLESIFRESVQPFIISILKYNPAVEIKKLEIPILLINGTKDLQVSVEDAKKLKEANPNSELVIIENMNHVFKEIKGDNTENVSSYTNIELPIIPELTRNILIFLNKQ